jgi:hypothetical protein
MEIKSVNKNGEGQGYISPLKPSGYCKYHKLLTLKIYLLPTQCIDVFCMDVRTNSDYSLYSIN